MATSKNKNNKSVKSPTPNPSTVKSNVRQERLRLVSIRLTGNPEASWSDVGTAFTQALLERRGVELSETDVNDILMGVLDNFKSVLKSRAFSGKAKDVIEAFNVHSA